MTSVPIALTIAGSDPSGGAGLQADIKTFTALGVYGASIVTALTAQNTRGVSGAFAVPPGFIVQQFEAVCTDLNITAAKTGMLADAETVRAVVENVRRYGISPLIVDPVMVATSGDVLLSDDAIEVVRRDLIPLAELISPNLHEAARLLEVEPAKDATAMEQQAQKLLGFGSKAVVLKGGHLEGAEAVDILATASAVQRLSRPRIATRNTHGTGCTLAAAITAFRARGMALEDAVAGAKDFLWQALEAGKDIKVGEGAGPVDHLFALRRKH